MLLGIDGLLVTGVSVTGGGQTAVEVVTDPACEQARRCPGCGALAARVKDKKVTTRPRDVYLADRQILLCWRKKRWICGNAKCGRETFTESLPAVRARARLTARLRTRLGEAVGDDHPMDGQRCPGCAVCGWRFVWMMGSFWFGLRCAAARVVSEGTTR